ncbi:G protein-regulated inducer of neurite outgrowth 3 [Dryobates pubescens]|uniref:G protein-regulated inducer of neurite outgrowth 3 n=1 Tax=Dryobates pubescens TaxID=118200 RepID=UPI0023B97FA2|nr:G protein-regulated inducer of neurite outgrowth 3 [Dryobates pubescens]XP_054020900.1 G protein-regulated inducer of neurite outgrowth 3 [Dryobates pubescens]
MGTVPDPLRSAKLSLVTASEKEDCLGDLQSAKHQPKLPSEERASNGFPFIPPDSAGVCLFDLKHTAAASVPRCVYKDNASHQEAFPPGLSSKASEECSAAVDSADSSCPAGSEGLAAPALTTVGAPLGGQGPEMMPAPQSSQQFVQGSQAKTGSLTQMDDSALKPQGTDDQPALEVLNYSSLGHPIRGNESCCTSQANLLQRGEKDRGTATGSAVCQTASPARHTKADLGRDPQTTLEAISGAADTAQMHLTDKTEVVQGSKAPVQSSHGSPHPIDNTVTEPGSPGPTQLSKYREMGTMTVQPESNFLTEEAVSRTWRDAEVQAVATVESKSASTSPSILAAFLKGNPPPEEKEELHIIYHGGTGLSQSAITDSLSSKQKSPCSPGIVSESAVVVAVTAPAQTQPVQLPGFLSDVVPPASAVNAKLVPSSSSAALISQGTSVCDAEIVGTACGGKDAAQLPMDAQVPPKPIPEKLAVGSNNQTPAQTESGTGEPSTTSAATVPGTKNNLRDLVHDTGSSCLPLRNSTDSEVKQKEVLGSSDQKPAQSKGTSQGETIPNTSVVKPKEENSVVLDAKGGMSASYPVTVCIEACSEDAGEKESRGQGDTGQAQMARGQSLQAGLMPELRLSSARLTPPLEASAAPQQQGLQAKESRRELQTAVLPTSAQALPNVGENKKVPTPAMEAKVQMKQSKHVRDVIWDEQGMTWEVYGASLDPESLGIAIQNHLQRQIREHEKLIRAQNSQSRKSISSDTSSNKKLKGRQHNMFQAMLQNLRRPNCCVRPAPSSVLD